MKIVAENKIKLSELKKMAEESFGNLVKGVVDIEKKIMVIGGELHSDEEAFLLENGSEQKNIWGINIYPEKIGDDFIEFDSIINLRPSFGNRTRGIESYEIRNKIIEIVKGKVENDIP
ncbi:MAG TPA: DUF5674 family protein [Candidatus Ratteibacteria bacterium]|nr:DUF5674 family protein [bacterium]HRR96769.1 DUF5674 family protein [Candidatus Ratteibacteria bacterium]